MSKNFLLAMTILFLVSSLVLAGCAADARPKSDEAFAIAAMSDLPAEVKAAPQTVQQAYQFAVENPVALKQIPCYCGCGAMGHKSNYACYISGVEVGKQINFDTHALGCSICVDITLDTMRLLKDGKDMAQIKAYVDQNYSQYGPSNIP